MKLTQKLFKALTFICISSIPLSAFAQYAYKKPGNKILVVSGGGARGAWGVGVAESLYNTEGGYRAVFGTSTGSIMAPLILLQQFDSLKSYYTGVTQESIFSRNPFKVKKKNGVVTTQLKFFNAVWRLICGRATIGESENLKKLIKNGFTAGDFQALKNRYSSDSLSLNVAVTNMNTGRVETRSSDNETDYERMINWIWASANEPVFMSYVNIDGCDYVDGGLREVVPLRAAVDYAISHAVDTVDVIVNDSWESQDTAWTITKNKGYFAGGLIRVLHVYNANTQFSDLETGQLLTRLHGVRIYNDTAYRARDLTIIIYSMPYSLASTCKDELGFEKIKMHELLNSGIDFIIKREYDAMTRQVYRATKL
ncbi:MAG TPA: patatin-like phospholipase family protein [Bacteroidia bacterium]|nr:patatin-like phospholipase family protein [Bacteroidia bacterium]